MAIAYVELGSRFHSYVVSQGHWLSQINGVWQSDNDSAVQALINSYPGSAQQLADTKADKQLALDAFLDANFDFKSFIRSGSSVVITGVQIGTFIATINNNYRTLRAAIAAALSVAAVNAININAGWPSNP